MVKVGEQIGKLTGNRLKLKLRMIRPTLTPEQIERFVIYGGIADKGCVKCLS